MKLYLSKISLFYAGVWVTLFLSAPIVLAGAPNKPSPDMSVAETGMVTAEYITTQCAIACQKPTKRIWWMFRMPAQVEFRDINLQTGLPAKNGELWRLSPDGKLNYVYLMHQDQRAIEYLFDDLRILGIQANQQKWQILTQLVTTDELAAMKRLPVKIAPVQGFTAEAYAGHIHDAKVTLTWLPQLRLPVKIEYTYPKSTVTITLQPTSIHPSSSTVISTTAQQLDTYQRVYYTDIGDMEQNAEAQTWIAKAQGAPGLYRHQH